MPNAQSQADVRIVVVDGERSYLLLGDRDKLKLGDAALPMLLHEGWKIKGTYAAGDRLHVLLGGWPVPVPETVERHRYKEALLATIEAMTPEEQARLVEEERAREQAQTK